MKDELLYPNTEKCIILMQFREMRLDNQKLIKVETSLYV